MLYLVMPWGKNFGWGVCGRYLVKELSAIDSVKFVTKRFDRNNVDNELEYRCFQDKLLSEADVNWLKADNRDSPVLQAISDHHLEPYEFPVTAPLKVGYTFFEAIVPEASIVKASAYFDVVATGSNWCTEMLQARGLLRATTVIQGIDPLTFNPAFAQKELYRDRFVVFSGGKFEFRKGQDLVIRAYKVLQDKHADVMLVNSWCNMWDFSLASMNVSPYIRFQMTSGDYLGTINRTLGENGIDLTRVITLPLHNNETVARIYQNTDVGLFPNRCEGGTNLVMMEYMACGKPVIASNSTGHKDVLASEHSLMVHKMRPLTLLQNEQPYAIWDDPDLDEIVHLLEWSYDHRDELRAIGLRAGSYMSQLTWKRSAENFHRLLTAGAS